MKRIEESVFAAKGKPEAGGKKRRAYNQGGFVRLAERPRLVPTALVVFAETPQFHGAAYHINAIQR